ncbi:MAG: hypothetical protein ACI9LG_001906, partial [Moritella dasanensis]
LIYHKVYDMHLNDYIIFYPKYDVIKYLHTYKIKARTRGSFIMTIISVLNPRLTWLLYNLNV